MDSESTPSSKHAVAGEERPRVYQQWQGNERFFCGGRCVAGPNWKSCIGSVALIAGPSLTFVALVAPDLGARTSWVIMVVSLVLPCLCLTWLLMTACRDPGVLPRQDPDEEWLQGRKPRTKDVIVNGHRVQVRYNDSCHFYQPPRAHHCSVNDNCIERFDHHCPWVGTTIGLRNYRTFLLFIYTTTVFIIWTFSMCMWSIFLKHRELVDAARARGQPTELLWSKVPGQCIPAIVLLCYTFIFLWFVGGLSGFHSYLVATNQTTYENFRYNHSATPNPYDMGVLPNCASVWCGPVPPSKVDFRAYVGQPPPAGSKRPSGATPASSPAASAAAATPAPRPASPPSLEAAVPALASMPLHQGNPRGQQQLAGQAALPGRAQQLHPGGQAGSGGGEGPLVRGINGGAPSFAAARASNGSVGSLGGGSGGVRSTSSGSSPEGSDDSRLVLDGVHIQMAAAGAADGLGAGARTPGLGGGAGRESGPGNGGRPGRVVQQL